MYLVLVKKQDRCLLFVVDELKNNGRVSKSAYTTGSKSDLDCCGENLKTELRFYFQQMASDVRRKT